MIGVASQLLKERTSDVRRSSLVQSRECVHKYRGALSYCAAARQHIRCLHSQPSIKNSREPERSVNRQNVDARQEARYPVAAPVSFWWPCSGSSLRAGEGFTRNISTRGVHVSTTACPPAGVCIQMTIFLPPPDGGIHGVTLEGEGVVLRMDGAREGIHDTDIKGFAAAIEFYPEQRSTSRTGLQSLESVLKTFVN